jgi:hypothetical protein
LIKVDWLNACTLLRGIVAVLVVFLSKIVKFALHNPPASGKQWPIPEEISQTLLTNKKQGNLD